MRFRQVRGRPHEETPVYRGPVSIASLVVAVTVKPPETLPHGVHAADVLEDLREIVEEAVEHWWMHLGFEFCETVPDVA